MSDSAGTGGHARSGLRAGPATVACWAAAGVLPFWSVYVAHVVRGANRPTGFIVADMPYYAANAREIFERGNGFAYCNPYDPDPAAPVIYFHWLFWVLGILIRGLGLPPGLALAGIGAAGGFLCAWVSYRLVEAILPTPRCVGPCFLGVMWGGGLLTLASIAANLASGRPLLHDPLQCDPFGGWWFLNWGRNLVMPTEAVYHALVAVAWLGIVRGRVWAAVAAVAALAATHPFSGIQHLLVTGAWLVWQRPRTVAAALPLLAVTAVTAVFCGYYFAFLPSYSQHREVHGTWSLAWTLPLPSLLAAYAPVGCLAAARCWRDRQRWRPEMSFFLVAATVSLLLVKHELFLPARQPLHFTRGYVWTPLCLLGLPLVQAALARGLARPRTAGRLLAMAAGGSLAVLDNAVFVTAFWNQPPQRHQDVRVSDAMHEAFRLLDRAGLRGTALVVKPPGDDWEDYNYLLATYTGMTPLIGHPWLCPGQPALQAEAEAWEATGAVSPRIAALEAIVVPRGFAVARLPGGAAAWSLWGRGGTVDVFLSREAADRARGRSPPAARGTLTPAG